MSVHRTKKQSDIEKRFKHLEFQLYGKPDKKKLEVRDEKSEISHFPSQIPTSHISHPTSTSDTTFLRHDLTKIAILSSLAVSVQLLLHFALSNNLLKLPI
jgi:hypothetical protein